MSGSAGNNRYKKTLLCFTWHGNAHANSLIYDKDDKVSEGVTDYNCHILLITDNVVCVYVI